MRRALAALIALAALPARADELTVNAPVELALTGAGGAAWILSEAVFKSSLAPDHCRWCATNGLDDAVRDALRWSSPGTANTISSVTGFALAPLSAFGLIALSANHDGRLDAFWTDALLILEAGVVASDVNQITKFAVGRERPRVHYGAPSGNDDNLSFYSGHTSWTFSLAVASGTVASVRGYRLAPVVWASGLTIAAATGYLRIAGDQHYFTDVLCGAVIGSAIGFVLPYLHRRTGTEVTPVATARTVGLSFRF